MYINFDGEVLSNKIFDNKHNSFIIKGIILYILFVMILCCIFNNYFYLWIGTEIFLLVFLFFTISFYRVKYELSKEGIWVKYPFESKKFVPWHDFQEVCVCYVFKNRAGGAFVAICFVKKGQKKTRFPARWKHDNPFMYRQIYIMDYSFELYKEVKGKCPLEIVDLRNTPGYTHAAFTYHRYLEQEKRNSR